MYNKLLYQQISLQDEINYGKERLRVYILKASADRLRESLTIDATKTLTTSHCRCCLGENQRHSPQLRQLLDPESRALGASQITHIVDFK